MVREFHPGGRVTETAIHDTEICSDHSTSSTDADGTRLTRPGCAPRSRQGAPRSPRIGGAIDHQRRPGAQHHHGGHEFQQDLHLGLQLEVGPPRRLGRARVILEALVVLRVVAEGAHGRTWTPWPAPSTICG